MILNNEELRERLKVRVSHRDGHTDLFLDGNKTFQIPGCANDHAIVGVSEQQVYVSYGNGWFSEVVRGPESEELTVEKSKYGPPNNPGYIIEDMRPVFMQSKRGSDNECLLVTGKAQLYGLCNYRDGTTGVDLLSMGGREAILGRADFDRMLGPRTRANPEPLAQLRVDELNKTIHLDLRDIIRAEIGCFEYGNVVASKDLTYHLLEAGIDIEKTIQLNKNYQRIRLY